MISAPSDKLARYHRLRASVPSKLWTWKVVAGWRWTKGREHINVLELRSILTTLRWRVEHRLQSNVRLLRLTDSLVCLHCLSRGRSSSRELRRTLCRINALVLASNLQPVCGYIHTDQNPADKPSRWGGKSAMPKRFLEGRSVGERAQQRQKLGTLKDLTVQPATKRRLDQFLTFLKSEGKDLPRDKSLVDPLACEYLEHMWSSGLGRGQACDTLAGLQDLQPNLKNCLPGAWRLLKTWQVNEIPNRAPPLLEHVVQAMAGWAFFKGYFSFGVSLLGF